MTCGHTEQRRQAMTCGFCHAPLPPRFRRAPYCHAGCREAAKQQRAERRAALDSFDAFCAQQRMRVRFQSSVRVNRILKARTCQEGSPLAADHEVQVRGRM